MAHLHAQEEAVPLLVVIGCGNLNRSDDAAGVRVIQQLRRDFGDTLPADVRLFDAGTGGMDVMFQARGARQLIIVDACRSGTEAGAIFRLPGTEIDTVHQPAYSLHDFRWDHAVHAGSEAIVASAKARGVPIVSSLQMLQWLDGRNASSFRNLTWSGSTLTFAIDVGAGANGLQALLPASSGAGPLTMISRGLSSLSVA